MEDKEIKEFISKSITQIKEGTPDGCAIDGKFDFDISLMTTKEKDGRIDIKLASGGILSQSQIVHRVKFSIVDEKSQKKNLALAMTAIRQFGQELITLDQKSQQLEYNSKKAKK